MGFVMAEPQRRSGIRDRGVAVRVTRHAGRRTLQLRPTKRALDEAGIEIGDHIDVWIDDEHGKVSLRAGKGSRLVIPKSGFLCVALNADDFPLLYDVPSRKTTVRVSREKVKCTAGVIDFDLPDEIYEDE